MTVYTVHAPPGSAGAAVDPLDFAFIKEGFCWPALFFAPLWLIVRRLWLALLGYLVISIGLSALSRYLDGPAIPVISVLFTFLFALEANELRRWTLTRRGWRLVGVAEGQRRDEAELRFFQAWLETPHNGTVSASLPGRTGAAPVPPARRDDGVIGLFPTPGAPA